MKNKYNIADLRWAMDIYLGKALKIIDLKKTFTSFLKEQNKIIKAIHKYKKVK